MNIAIILAGGVGTRSGNAMPKQFVEVLGKPVIYYTIANLEGNENIDAIEIVVHKDYIPYCKELVAKYKFTKARYITEGGKNFQESALKGVFNLEGKVHDDDIVLLHFAVSPMTTDAIINDAIEVCKKHSNAFSADPIVLSLCTKNDLNHPAFSNSSVDRESVLGLNAPWCFKYGIILTLYKRAISENILDKLEPHTTSLLFYYRHKIYLAKGSSTNIKITFKDDFDLFEGYLLLRQNKKIKDL